MKEFKEFLKEGIIRKISSNESIARDLFEESKRKTESLNQIILKIGILDNNANDIIEYCYDILIVLIRAKLFLEGYKSFGKGAHEAEISYLIIIGFSDSDARFLDELRYFRNGIKNYGKRFGKGYSENVIEFMKDISLKLRKLMRFGDE